MKNQEELIDCLTNPSKIKAVQKPTKPIRISRAHAMDDINKLLEDPFKNLFSGYTLTINSQQNRNLLILKGLVDKVDTRIKTFSKS